MVVQTVESIGEEASSALAQDGSAETRHTVVGIVVLHGHHACSKITKLNIISVNNLNSPWVKLISFMDVLDDYSIVINIGTSYGLVSVFYVSSSFLSLIFWI